jgi:hypothetical protein
MQHRISAVSLFVVSFAAFASSVALAGYLLSAAGFKVVPFSLVVLALVLCVVVVFPFVRRGVRVGVERFDVVMMVVVVLVVLKLVLFFSGRPVGGSVDLAHYFFATDWISTRGDLGFVDYSNASGYYYLWHTWEGWWWYYGFEFLASLLVGWFGVLGGVNAVVLLSSVVSALCVGLIARRIAGELGGVLASLQLLLFPAFFYLAFQDFFANLLGVAIGLVLVYVSLDLRREALPLVFLLTAGGLLVHIHAVLVLLVPVVLYRVLCTEKVGFFDFLGFIAAVLLGFLTAYVLNSSAFNWYLFGATPFIVVGSGARSAYEEVLFGVGDFFGHWVFLIVGVAGFFVLFERRCSRWLLPALWFSLFAGALVFFIAGGKVHWANRMAFFFVYPLAVACGVFYLWVFEFAGARLGVGVRRSLVPLVVFLLAVSAVSPVAHYDVSPAVYDAGLRLSGMEKNATVAFLQIPEPLPNPNKFFISAFSRHRVVWPLEKPDLRSPLSYQLISNFTYTNDYIPEWIGGVPENYTTFENYDAPRYLLVLFAGAANNVYYIFDLNNMSNNTCERVVSNREACSGVVELTGGDAALCVSGCFEPEDGGRWSGESAVVVLPTFIKENLSVTVVAGAFRPPGVAPAKVEVYFNGVLLGNFTTHDGYVNFTAQVGREYVSVPFSTLVVNTTTSWVPDEWIHNGDKRRLGVRLGLVEFG